MDPMPQTRNKKSTMSIKIKLTIATFLYFMFLSVYSALGQIANETREIRLQYAGRLSVERISDDELVTRWSDSVQIAMDTLVATARMGYQNELRKIAQLTQRVHLTDRHRDIYSDSLIIHLDREVFIFTPFFIFKDTALKLVVQGKRAIHHHLTNQTWFYGDLKIDYEEYQIKADSALVFGRFDSVLLWNNIEIQKKEILIHTNEAQWYKKAAHIVCSKPTEFIFQKSRLNGDGAEIFYTKQKIDSLWVLPYAKGRFIHEDTLKADSSSTIFSGKKIVFHLKDNKPRRIGIFQNAAADYSAWNAEKKERGFNRLTGNEIELRIENDSLRSIRVIQGIEGVYERYQYKVKEE